MAVGRGPNSGPNHKGKVFRLGVDFVLPLSQEEEQDEEQEQEQEQEEPSPKSFRGGVLEG